MQIEKLVNNFYAKVRTDALLGPVFNDVAKVNWQEHLPLLCRFWRSIMLKTGEYRGNAYSSHVVVGQNTEITEAHFVRWLNLFTEEAKACLTDQQAQTIIARAHSIAGSLRKAMLKTTS